MKILVISHTYIATINREKWKVFTEKYSDIKIKVVIPKEWPTSMFTIQAGDLTSYSSRHCQFISFDVFNSGNEILYRYKFSDLIKLIKGFQPDIIHVEQGDNAFSFFQSILLSKIFCKKAKFTFFTWINWKVKKTWKYKLIWNFVERFNLYFSNGAVVGNNDAKKILKDKKFKKPIDELLQLGVNEKFFKPALKIKDNKKVFEIGYIGRIVKEKGVFLLIDAFYKIAKDFLQWNLIFVGDGNDKEELVDYIREKNLQNRVIFKPAMFHEKIGNILNKLDILILPSYDTVNWKEQFGHVLIEAMACKVPIIGSSAGAIPFVIRDVGLIFEQKNVLALIDCLKSLMLDGNLRSKLGEKGFKKFKKNYSYEFIAERLYKFWKKIINSK